MKAMVESLGMIVSDKELAAMVKETPALCSLQLGSNMIGADGAADLAAAAALSPWLTALDLGVLSTFAYEPIREDMCRRGRWDEDADDNNLARLLAFAAVPVIGPCVYLLVRPELDD